MVPITPRLDVWLPVIRADRPSSGDLSLSREDRRTGRRPQRRRRREEASPDADEFTRAPEEKETEE